MIRRWSYINKINASNSNFFLIIRKSSVDVNMNMTMYLRRTYTISTTLTRRKWARRRHLYNWLHLANVLRNWASAYRFYRKLNTSIFNQFFFKDTWVAFNLISAKNSIPSIHNGSEDLVTASITKSFLRYCQTRGTNKYLSLRTFKYTNVALVSYHSRYLGSDISEPNTYIVPLSRWDLLQCGQQPIIRRASNSELGNILIMVKDVTLRLALTTHYLYYKLVILLFLKTFI